MVLTNTFNTSCKLLWTQEEVAGGQVRTVRGGGMVHHLDLLLGGQNVPGDEGGVDGGVVPVEDEPGLHFHWPLLLHFFKNTLRALTV